MTAEVLSESATDEERMLLWNEQKAGCLHSHPDCQSKTS